MRRRRRRASSTDEGEEEEDDENEDNNNNNKNKDNAKFLAHVERFMDQMKVMCCCPICFDFYHAPVMFPKCGHTFCSLCIRQALLFKDECPSCRIEARTNDLIPVRIVEGISALCQRITDKIEDERSPITFSTYLSRSSSELADSTESTQQQQQAPPCKRRRRNSLSNDTADNEQVECPDCKIKVHAENMERHKSVCPGKEEGWEELNRIAEANKAKNRITIEGAEYPKKRLPLLAYSVLNDKMLRKKCEEYKLPSRGSRVLREKRLKEYINRYNAEYDSDNPKTIQEILNDVINSENEYKQATKPQKKEKTQSKLSFKKLFDTIKLQKQDQQKQKKKSEECDSQQTQLSNYTNDVWNLETESQLEEERRKADEEDKEENEEEKDKEREDEIEEDINNNEVEEVEEEEEEGEEGEDIEKRGVGEEVEVEVEVEVEEEEEEEEDRFDTFYTQLN